MFNTYRGGDQTTSVKINAVTGTILKNHPKSWFERFHLNGDRAKQLLKEGGDEGQEWKKGQYSNTGWLASAPEKAIVVLQMVLCGDMEVLAECVYKKDYEEGLPVVVIREGKDS